MQSDQPFSWPFLDNFSLLHCSFFSSYHNLYPGLELVKEGVIKVKKTLIHYILYIKSFEILTLHIVSLTHREWGLPKNYMHSSQSRDKIKPQTTWLIPDLHRNNDEDW